MRSSLLISIISLAFLTPSGISSISREDLESLCVFNTSSRNISLDRHVVVDVGIVIKDNIREHFSRRHGVNNQGVQMGVFRSLTKVKSKFEISFISPEYNKYIAQIKNFLGPEDQGLRTIYRRQVNTYQSFRVDASSNNKVSDVQRADEEVVKQMKIALDYTQSYDSLLLETNGLSEERIVQILRSVNKTAYLPHFGLITPAAEGVVTGSVCNADREFIKSILNLKVVLLFVGPFHCEAGEGPWDCLSKIVTFVERCETDVKLGYPIMGIVATSSSFGRDYWTRAQFWCYLSQYTKKAGWVVVMLDDDGFIRDYMYDKLKWDGEEEGEEELTPTPREDKKTVYIVLTSLGCALIVLAVLLLVGVQWRRAKLAASSGLSKAEICEFFGGTGSEGIISWSISGYNTELEIAKDDIFLDFDTLLGSGAFGAVYKGRISGSMNDVAVKMTRKGSTDCGSMMRGLLSEIKVLNYLGSHPHLVGLVGAYTAELEKGVLYVVLELCSKGSLEKHLRLLKSPESSDYTYLDSEMEGVGGGDEETDKVFTELNRYCREICSGMEFLTSKTVIHGDLATRNVLLTSRLTAKIADFGLSRRLYEYTNYVKENQEPLPWRWMPPEALLKSEFSEKSDVWAFGVTMWEVFSMGNVPYPGLAWHAQFPKDLTEGLRLEIPDFCTTEVYDVMVRCWQNFAGDRPTFLDLQGLLTKFK